MSFAKEPVMHTRFVLIAAAALMSSSAFAAEQHKSPEQLPAQPAPALPRVVLASAETVRANAPAGQSPAAMVKRPHVAGRVTTCRCGDPQPSDTDADEEQ